MDTKDTSDKDFAALPRDQQFLELVRRKLRKANKKMLRITALESSLASSKAKVNDEQKQLLASKDTTSLMVKEFTDLQTQMLKIIDDKKETSSATSGSLTEEKKERPPRKDRKRNQSGTSAINDSSSSSTQQEAPKDQVETSSSAPQAQPVANQATESSNDQVNQQQSQPQDGSSSNQRQGEGARDQRGDRPPKQKREWEFQKDIYLAQFKSSFTEEHNGKYIAVSKGQLIGPFDTQEELTQSVGGDKKDPSIYLAQIGNEDKNPIRRSSSGRRERGDRNGGARGERNGSGSGRGRREGRDPSNSASGSPASRGGNGTGNQRPRGTGPRGGNGNGNATGSPSQGRTQTTQS